MTVLAEALAAAIAEKNGKLRCGDCGHRAVIHVASETGKKKGRCQGNSEKCKCQISFPSMALAH